MKKLITLLSALGILALTVLATGCTSVGHGYYDYYNPPVVVIIPPPPPHPGPGCDYPPPAPPRPTPLPRPGTSVQPPPVTKKSGSERTPAKPVVVRPKTRGERASYTR